MGNCYFFCNECQKDSKGNLVSTTTNYELKKSVNSYRCDDCHQITNTHHAYK